MEKDFHVKITVKNARIIRAMRAAGIKTVKELARRTMCGPTDLGNILSFKTSPLNKDGEWREAAWRISSALHLEPEELWPEHLARLKARKSSVEISMDMAELRNIGASSLPVLPRDCSAADVERLLSKTPMPARSWSVLSSRFGLIGEGEATLDDVAHELGITRERVRQIEAKALRALANTARKLKLAS